ncbi:hypothetical protein [Streptomyces sp. NRRL F-5123]|uniref:hypothetical protein n=1 Tax=Streptomyces sp. NRRL F-5123 TaxID=1463856 RepID=UPI000693A223|nr:hypothetical protein [Streptomyces sp. NRRL F-5123]
MAGVGERRRAGLARLLVLAGLLFGVLLMHGNPASAATGCHDGAMAAASAASSTSAVSSASAAFAASAASPEEHAAGMHGLPADGEALAGHDHAAPRGGEMCVAAPVRGVVLPDLGGAVAGGWAVAAGVLAAGAGWALRARRRGPPGDGRAVLLRGCVART